MGLVWSMHKNDGWRGRFNRVVRWHKRMIAAADTGSDDLEDYCYAFFQNCYHLHEWLQKTSKIPPADIKSFFTKTKELRLCRDICNGTKHLTLKHASVDAHFSILREYEPRSQSGYRLRVIADNKYDLLELATRCIDLLKTFIKANGLALK